MIGVRRGTVPQESKIYLEIGASEPTVAWENVTNEPIVGWARERLSSSLFDHHRRHIDGKDDGAVPRPCPL